MGRKKRKQDQSKEKNKKPRQSNGSSGTSPVMQKMERPETKESEVSPETKLMSNNIDEIPAPSVIEAVKRMREGKHINSPSLSQMIEIEANVNVEIQSKSESSGDMDNGEPTVQNSTSSTSGPDQPIKSGSQDVHELEAKEGDTSKEEKESIDPNSYFTTLQERIVHHGKSSFAFLKDNEEVIVHGRAQMRVLHGCVCVNGFKLKSHCPQYRPIYSPTSASLLTLSTSVQTTMTRQILDSIPASARAKVMNKWLQMGDNENIALVEFKMFDSRVCAFVSTIVPFNKLFVVPADMLKLQICPGLFAVVGSDCSKFKTTDNYSDVTAKIFNAVKTGNSCKVLLCGGKKTGKSSMSRYLVNCMLNEVASVAFLECDVGQTEFTPSGCVSLTLVTKPLLGPPFTHQTSPVFCMFYGMASPTSDPDEYISLVAQCYQYYEDNLRHIPLVVNTMGWNKDLGLALLVDTLHIVRPHYLIQVQSFRQGRNLPDMQPHNVASMTGWQNAPLTAEDIPFEYEHIFLQSAINQEIEHKAKFHAPELRQLALLGYFSQLNFNITPGVGTKCPLQAVRPYKIAWSDVALHVCSTPVPYGQLLYALNCSVVALCYVPEDQMLSPESADQPKYLANNYDATYIGLGIVRCIDPVEKLLYVMTPVPMDRLADVNTLIRGVHSLPDRLIERQETEDYHAELPYMDCIPDVPGSSTVVKRRLYLKR